MPYALALSPAISCKSSASSSNSNSSGGMQRYLVRNQSTTKSTIDGSVRKRVFRACEVCRRKKVKCDGQKPCRHCIAFAEKCYYVDTKDRSAYSRRYVESLEHRIAKMEHYIAIMKPCRCKTQPSEELSFENRNRFVAMDSSGMLQPESVNSLACTMDASQVAIDHDTNRGLGRSDQTILRAGLDSLAQSTSYTTTDQRSLRVATDHAQTQLPPEPVLQKLVGAFYTIVFPAFPIITEAELRIILMHIRAQEKQDDSIECTSLALLLSTLASGASTFSRNNEDKMDTELYDWANLGKTCHERSQQLMMGKATDDKFPVIQVYALQAFYVSATGSMSNAWVFANNAMRLAMHVGMHSMFMHTAITDGDREARLRVWWSVYMLDRLLGTILQRPFGVEDHDVDTAVPTESDGALKEVAPGFTALVHLSRISGRVARTMALLASANQRNDENEKQRQLAEIHFHNSALDAWTDSLPAALKVQTAQQSSLVQMQSCIASYQSQSLRLQLFEALQCKSELSPTSTENLSKDVAKCTQLATQIIHASTRIVNTIPPSPWLYDFANSVLVSGRCLALSAAKYDYSTSTKLLSKAARALDTLRSIEVSMPATGPLREQLAHLLQRVSGQPFLLLPSLPTTNTEDGDRGQPPNVEALEAGARRYRQLERHRAGRKHTATSPTTKHGADFVESQGGFGSVSDGYAGDTSRGRSPYSDIALQRLTGLVENYSEEASASASNSTRTDFGTATISKMFGGGIYTNDALFHTDVAFPTASQLNEDAEPYSTPPGCASASGRAGDQAPVFSSPFENQSTLGHLTNLLPEFASVAPCQSVSQPRL